MPSSDGSMFDLIGILAVRALVVANGFFVAAEFSLVAVRRSRVAGLVSARRTNATALQRAVANLYASLAATQPGITISSLRAFGFRRCPMRDTCLVDFGVVLERQNAVPG